MRAWTGSCLTDSGPRSWLLRSCVRRGRRWTFGFSTSKAWALSATPEPEAPELPGTSDREGLSAGAFMDGLRVVHFEPAAQHGVAELQGRAGHDRQALPVDQHLDAE